MLKYLVFPALVLAGLAFASGIIPTIWVALALVLTIGLNRFGNSKALSERSLREIAHEKSEIAGGLIFALSCSSVILAVVVSIFFFRVYGWVVGGGYILAFLGYFLVMNAFESTEKRGRR